MTYYIDLRRYDLVLTTDFEFRHGISGHMFELIEYYWLVKDNTKIKPCILLTDSTTKEEFSKALHSKYTNIDDIEDHIFVHEAPKILLTQAILLVDGSGRGMQRSHVFAKSIFIFRCSESDFSYFEKNFDNVYLLQDFSVYGPSKNAVDYNKKILFSRLKIPRKGPKDTAMLYLTSTCRAIPQEDVTEIVKPFKDYVVLTNTPTLYNNSYQVPVDNMFELFDTYIYTAIPKQFDCSSRLIKECEYFGRKVIYNIDYIDKALEVRRNNSIEDVTLSSSDYFLELINDKCKPPKHL